VRNSFSCVAERFNTCTNTYLPCPIVLCWRSQGLSFHFLKWSSLQRLSNFVFRPESQARVLWVDQICINQTDVPERSSQVLLMRDFYKRATRTRIWLGEAATDPPNSIAFDLLADFLRNIGLDMCEQIMQIGRAQPTYKHDCEAVRDYLLAEDSWFKYYDMHDNMTRSRFEEGRQDPALRKVCHWFRKACIGPENINRWRTFFQLLERPW
jgi:hypothetical protein